MALVKNNLKSLLTIGSFALSCHTFRGQEAREQSGREVSEEKVGWLLGNHFVHRFQRACSLGRPDHQGKLCSQLQSGEPS